MKVSDNFDSHDRESYYNLEQRYQYAFSEENSEAYRKRLHITCKNGTFKFRTFYLGRR